MSVEASADEFVFLFEGDSAALILSEVPAGPQGKTDAYPSECDSRDRGRVGAIENALTKRTHVDEAAEEQDEAGDYQKNVARTRVKGLCGHRLARLQRARRPVPAEDDPAAFDEIMPNQCDSAPLRRPSPGYVGNNASRF